MIDTLEKFSPAWWEAMTIPEPNSGCLLWLGYACPQGYGRVSVRGKRNRSCTAHRAAYECAHGPFDESLTVCHSCDTPLCVNPDHLFIGTQKENLRDMRAKGRAREWGRGRKVTRVLIAREPVVRLLARTPALATSNENPRKSGEESDILHHIRTRPLLDAVSADVPTWCRVTGVPPTRPTQAIVPYTSPRDRTRQPSPERLLTVATPALCCQPSRVSEPGAER
jgi:hypothetical protein